MEERFCRKKKRTNNDRDVHENTPHTNWVWNGVVNRVLIERQRDRLQNPKDEHVERADSTDNHQNTKGLFSFWIRLVAPNGQRDIERPYDCGKKQEAYDKKHRVRWMIREHPNHALEKLLNPEQEWNRGNELITLTGRFLD